MTHSVSKYKTEIFRLENQIARHKNCIAILELGDNFNMITKHYEAIFKIHQEIEKINKTKRVP